MAGKERRHELGGRKGRKDGGAVVGGWLERNEGRREGRSMRRQGKDVGKGNDGIRGKRKGTVMQNVGGG